MVREHGGVIELDLIVLWCEGMTWIWLFSGARACGSDRAGFDCFVVREHGGAIELDLIVLWCESMGE